MTTEYVERAAQSTRTEAEARSARKCRDLADRVRDITGKITDEIARCGSGDSTYRGSLLWEAQELIIELQRARAVEDPSPAVYKTIVAAAQKMAETSVRENRGANQMLEYCDALIKVAYRRGLAG